MNDLEKINEKLILLRDEQKILLERLKLQNELLKAYSEGMIALKYELNRAQQELCKYKNGLS
jgi:hypothetical protein